MYEELKQFIDARIFPNGQQRITGQRHQEALHAVVDTLGRDIAQKRDLTDKEVFIAVKGTTTFEQLEEAFNAGKAVFIGTAYQNSGNVPVLLPLISRRTDQGEVGRTEYVFAGVVDDGPATVAIVWSRWYDDNEGGYVESLPDYATRTVLATATALNGKYTKPADGIPVSDLDSGDIDNDPTEDSGHLVKSGGVYSALGHKYSLPSDGIPESDLSQAVQDKLNSGGGGGLMIVEGRYDEDNPEDTFTALEDQPTFQDVAAAFFAGTTVLFRFANNPSSMGLLTSCDTRGYYMTFGNIADDEDNSSDAWQGSHD